MIDEILASYTVRWGVLALVTAASVAFMLAAMWRERRTERRAMLFFITLAVYAYSGIGVSYLENWPAYALRYLCFLAALLIGMKVGLKRFVLRRSDFDRDAWRDRYTKELLRYTQVYRILSYVFVAAVLVYLVVPENRLHTLIAPPMPSILGIFEKREVKESHTILTIADTLNVFLLPFFLVYLYTLSLRGRKPIAVAWMLAWFYLDYLKFGYFGRNQFLIDLALIFFLAFCLREGGISIPRKYIAILPLILIVLSPLLLFYESFREGSESSVTNATKGAQILFLKETDYSKYYDIIAESEGIVDRARYLSWLACQPIPRFLWNGKPNYDINEVFSVFLTGVARGEDRFNVLLPSVLGEAMLVWGRSLYWLNAALLGLIIGLFSRFFESSRVYSLLYVYFCIQTLVIGRAGMSAYIPSLVNSCVSVVLWSVLITVLSSVSANRARESLLADSSRVGS